MNTLPSVRNPKGYNRAMGIEWECYLRPNVFRNMQWRHQNFFYCGEDGSLGRFFSNEVGAELVSQPLTVPWLHKQLDKVNKDLGDLRTHSDCGIHVHVSRQWVSGDNAKQLQKILCSILQREFYLLFGRFPNNYCVQSPHEGRYCVVNLRGPKTIEIRGFASGQVNMCHYAVAITEYMANNISRWRKTLTLPESTKELLAMAERLKKHYGLEFDPV